MPDAVKIHIGSQSRELRFDFDSVEMAERLLGGEDIQSVLAHKRSALNIFKIAAAGFSEFAPGGKGKKISPPQVKAWCKEDPAKFLELLRAVDLAVALHLVETKQISEEDAKLLGEGLAGDAPASAGTAPSAKPAASE